VEASPVAASPVEASLVEASPVEPSPSFETVAASGACRASVTACVTPPARDMVSDAPDTVSEPVMLESLGITAAKSPLTEMWRAPVPWAGSATETVSVVAVSVSQTTSGVSVVIAVPLTVTPPGTQKTAPAAAAPATADTFASFSTTVYGGVAANVAMVCPP
jgi:hypothetical protein